MSYIGNRPVDVVGTRSGGSEPTTGSIGELFYNTTTGELLVWNGSAWAEVTGSNGVVTGSTLPSTGSVGQLFYLTTNNKLYVRNLTTWEILNGTLSGTSLPASGTVGDTFYVTTTNLLHIWNGTAWDVIGGGSNVNSGTVTPLTGSSVGQLFYNTVTQTVLIWSGVEWLTVSTVSTLLPPTGPSLPSSGTEGEIFYNTTEDSLYVYANGDWTSLMSGSTPSGTTLPLSGEVGELFFDSSDGNVYVWNGSEWVTVGGSTNYAIAEVGDPLPVSSNVGQIFYRTSDSNLYVWNGSLWQLVSGDGDIGYTGSQGIQGPIGFTGSEGIQGAIGFTGSQGIQGIQGPIGFTGSKGTDGTSVVILGSLNDVSELPPSSTNIGDGYLIDGFLYIWDGSQWLNVGQIQGPQGDVGFTGSQGIQGIQGVIGFTGSQGIQGIIGFTGSQGIQGVIGFTGSRGLQGAPGFTGSQGIQGNIGFTGSQGIQGVTGFVGSQGIQGPIGFTGSKGDDGVDVGATLPTTATDGSIFYLTSDNELYVRSEGSWVSLQDSVVEIGSTFPSPVVSGYQFFNTTDLKLYIYDGSDWVSVSDTASISSNTGVAYYPTTSLSAAFTAPSTPNTKYIIESIQVTNINTINETVTVDWFDSSLSAGYFFANAIPVPVGSSVELLKRPKVIDPNDLIRIQSSENGTISTTILYSTSANVKNFGVGRTIASTNAETVYTASDKSQLNSILLVNRGALDTKVSITWTNSANAIQSYLSFEMVIPVNGSVELLEKSKSIPSGHLIRAQADVGGAIDVHVSGQLV